MSSTALTQSTSSSQIQRTSSQNAVAKQSSQAHAQVQAPPKQNDTPVQTPGARTPQQMLQRPSPAYSSPGKWEHPRMQEILRRQHLNTFDQSNAKRVIFSVMALLSTYFIPGLFIPHLSRSIIQAIPAELQLLLYGFQLLLLANITFAIIPLVRSQDTMEDIPLTPQQRKLLDLPPMSRPATPQEQAAWVTPPRYSRNGTPTSVDSTTVNARDTPMSARGSPRGYFQATPPPSVYASPRVGSGSPYAGSPLAARNTDVSNTRRESVGSGRGSPLTEKDLFGVSMKSSRASTGLNNKWLYEKTKNSPPTTGFLGTGWGTGSVFT